MPDIKVHPIPGRMIPGVPTTVQEFDSKAAAEKWLKAETGGLVHAGAFSLDKPDPDAVAAYAVAPEPEEEAASPPAAKEAEAASNGSEE